MSTVVDYAGRPPGAAAIKAAGHIGAVRYISGDRTGGGLPGKPVTLAEVEDYRRQGLETAFCWQYGKDSTTAPPDVMRGREGGLADARAAQAKLSELGRPDHPVFFAVDFDISVAEWNRVAVHYFRAAGEVLGVDRVGIYGHSRVCHWAGPEDGVIGRSGNGWLAWQTRSWSAGALGRDYCVLYQGVVDTPTSPGPRINGTVVDVNDVWAQDWGQKPRPRKETPSVNIRPNPGHRGDPLFLPDVLRAFGLDVVEDNGWREWGMGDFNVIWGTVAHHTGANNTSTAFIKNNPLLGNALSSQIHLARNGKVSLLGAGIAYHAGVGSYPGIATNNANAVTIGIEAQGDGQTWPDVQMDAYYRVCAAICWYLGHSSLRVIAHHEWGGGAQGKWDPGLYGKPMPMAPFRARVQHYIDNPPFLPSEDDMADFWNEQVPSLVDPSKHFPRRDFLQLTDYHATLANIQSRQALAELALMREDNARMADLLEQALDKLNKKEA